MQMQWRSPKLSLGGGGGAFVCAIYTNVHTSHLHKCPYLSFKQMSIPLIYQLKTFGKGWPSALLSGGAQASNKERPDHRQGTDSPS